MLLTDVVMPELGGVEPARQLAALQPGIRVLYMSGDTHGAIADQAAPEAETLMLNKPFSPGSLVRTVRQTLDQPNAV